MHPYFISITVIWLIIGDDLFGEIGEFKKFVKISCHQIITLQSLYIAVLEIAKLTPKLSYLKNHQIFSFYLKPPPPLTAPPPPHSPTCYQVL